MNDTTGTIPRAAPTVALLIPCYNEEQTVARVIEDFRRQRPDLAIVVIDNNSRDRTSEVARQAGAAVMHVRKQGKGNAIRSTFQRVDADYYVMVDGDATYEAASVNELLAPVLAGQADMVVGRRISRDEKTAYRPMHVFGNRLVGKLIKVLFRTDLTDIMSGYRAFSREVVRATPLVSRGFEIETELTIQALGQDFTIVERDTAYYARPEGSFSKLSTYRDGAKVLWTIASLFMAYKPLTFFGAIGLVQVALGLLLALIPLTRRLFSGYSGGSATVFALCAGFLGVGGLSFIVLGVVLTNINNRFMAMTSLLNRGRLSETHPLRFECSPANGPANVAASAHARMAAGGAAAPRA